MTEAETRKLIDAQLLSAGWSINNRAHVSLESKIGPSGITDYRLHDADGTILAIIEAKKFSRAARDGEPQLRDYIQATTATQPYPPFGFLANGQEIHFVESPGHAPRRVAGFFPAVDLIRLRHIRIEAIPMSSLPIRLDIVDRAYQHEAARRTAEAFDIGRRHALLVMATGTGKTRTIMALIDLCLRANAARRVLFVADRDELVKQALDDGFKAFLPDEPSARVLGYKIDPDKRLYVATEQTMRDCYRKFSPSAFDLIIIDEAHRSIFNRFTEVIDYFDARIIGLTATPAQYLDRDSFRAFRCEANVPTFLYPYETAVTEGYLADYTLYQAQTGFQRNGIRGLNLSDEHRQSLTARGIDPDEIDYHADDIEDTISNRGTLRAQWKEILEVCHKDQSGQLPAKTIIFATSQAHAHRLCSVFQEEYPQWGREVQVITSSVDRVRDGTYGDGLLKKFKKEESPRIAISVDMLDTGVDVPEVMNLVFMKPVVSPIKLWQMIGRGTRPQEACKFLHRLPGGRKEGFLIIDFWQNDFGRVPGPLTVADLPILVRLFHTRLRLLETELSDPATPATPAAQSAIAALRGMIARIPLDCFPVQQAYPAVSEAWQDSFWRELARADLPLLRLHVAPLLRFTAEVDVASETFTHKVERLKLGIRAANIRPALIESIADDVRRLPRDSPELAGKKASIQLALSADLATASTPALDDLIADLAGEMWRRRKQRRDFLEIDLPDLIETRAFITVGEGGQQIPVAEYRNRVEGRIHDLAAAHPALAALRRGEIPSDEILITLERTLHQEFSGGDGIPLNSRLIGTAFGIRTDSFLGFLRHLLGLPDLPDYRQLVTRSFNAFLTGRHYTGDQLAFLRTIQEVFLKRRTFTEADFYESPLTSYGRNAAEKFLSPEDRAALLEMTGRLAA